MKSLLQRCPALGAALILIVGATFARAAPVPAALTQQDTLELQRIAAYLNNIRTMTARFQQIANNGGVSTGHMWVARPGRMRFEYDPPTPITLLADSASVYYWDKQLNQTSKYELRQTPAWFFLRDPISFGAGRGGDPIRAAGRHGARHGGRGGAARRRLADAGFHARTR